MNSHHPERAYRKRVWGTILIAALMLASMACGLSTGITAEESATVEAIAQEVVARATENAASGSFSDAAIETAQAKSTEIIQAAAATQASQEDIGDESRQATQAAFEPLRSQLFKYDVDPNAGKPGWLHPPVTLELEGKNQYDYANQFLGVVAADFVVSADITWNTQYGGSGCGFVLRSDGNEDAFNQYIVVATRASNGHVLFLTMANGEVVTGQDMYAYGQDPEFDWKNDTTNRLTVVGRGNRFSIYTNDTKIGEVNPNDPPPQPYFPPPPEEPDDKDNAMLMAAYAAQKAEYETVVNQIRSQYNARLRSYREADKEFDKGFIAMVALSESGQTMCQFDNAWLWLIEE